VNLVNFTVPKNINGSIARPGEPPAGLPPDRAVVNNEKFTYYVDVAVTPPAGSPTAGDKIFAFQVVCARSA
jgi:hypothetical protein